MFVASEEAMVLASLGLIYCVGVVFIIKLLKGIHACDEKMAMMYEPFAGSGVHIDSLTEEEKAGEFVPSFRADR